MHLFKKYLGFSLIELMIVVAIISILATIAIPSYQHYLLRARFAEIITATSPYKIAITLALQQGISLDEIRTGKNGIPNSPHRTKNLDSLDVTDGTITATGTSLVKNSTYILKPNTDGSEFTVSGTCINEGYCDA